MNHRLRGRCDDDGPVIKNRQANYFVKGHQDAHTRASVGPERSTILLSRMSGQEEAHSFLVYQINTIQH